jgi:glycerol-3-phosphate dehydrogenase (NAD(P)+)
VRLAIIGGGSWGTALAIALEPRAESVRLWVWEADLAERMRVTRENDVFLLGFVLSGRIEVTSDLGAALDGADIVLGVMPSRHARRLYAQMLPHVPGRTILVSATKGLEQKTLLRMSEVIHQVMGRNRIAALSGPTFAREIARGEPAALVVASSEADVALEVQEAFSGPAFRLYTNTDLVGVEIAAALKNVIAIAAGVCQGLGLGSNTQAALITRGLAEITRLAVAMGGQPRTLAGLAGLGDLVLTCTGDLSRNRKVGIELAGGKTLPEITGAMRMVAEGVETCDVAVELGSKFAVDLPIVQQMHSVLHGRTNPRQALRELMERSLKGE